MKRIALMGVVLFAAACGPGTADPYVPIAPTLPPIAPTAEATPGPSVDEPTRSADKKDQYYRNCAEAKEAGAAPLRRDVDDGYRSALDRDKDGIACD